MIRSFSPSLIITSACAMLVAMFRCVSITPLAAPVVPLE